MDRKRFNTKVLEISKNYQDQEVAKNKVQKTHLTIISDLEMWSREGFDATDHIRNMVDQYDEIYENVSQAEIMLDNHQEALREADNDIGELTLRYENDLEQLEANLEMTQEEYDVSQEIYSEGLQEMNYQEGMVNESISEAGTILTKLENGIDTLWSRANDLGIDVDTSEYDEAIYDLRVAIETDVRSGSA